MKYPFTNLFFKPKEKEISVKKELPREKEIPREKDIDIEKDKTGQKTESPPTPTYTDIAFSHLRKCKCGEICTCGYAIDLKNEPDKPSKTWWLNQMNKVKKYYSCYNFSQDQLNRIVGGIWNDLNDWAQKSIREKRKLKLKKIKALWKSRKIKKESVI